MIDPLPQDDVQCPSESEEDLGSYPPWTPFPPATFTIFNFTAVPPSNNSIYVMPDCNHTFCDRDALYKEPAEGSSKRSAQTTPGQAPAPQGNNGDIRPEEMFLDYDPERNPARCSRAFSVVRKCTSSVFTKPLEPLIRSHVPFIFREIFAASIQGSRFHVRLLYTRSRDPDARIRNRGEPLVGTRAGNQRGNSQPKAGL